MERMGFWIFMLVMNLLIPLSMIGIGAVFRRAAPREINPVFGYRTALSMKNRETWEFAHRHCGKVWITTGWVLLPLTIAVMLPLLGRPEDAVGLWGGVVCGVQTAVLIASIFPTEMALRKNFHKNGFRKTSEH